MPIKCVLKQESDRHADLIDRARGVYTCIPSVRHFKPIGCFSIGIIIASVYIGVTIATVCNDAGTKAAGIILSVLVGVLLVGTFKRIEYRSIKKANEAEIEQCRRWQAAVDASRQVSLPASAQPGRVEGIFASLPAWEGVNMWTEADEKEQHLAFDLAFVAGQNISSFLSRCNFEILLAIQSLQIPSLGMACSQNGYLLVHQPHPSGRGISIVFFKLAARGNVGTLSWFRLPPAYSLMYEWEEEVTSSSDQGNSHSVHKRSFGPVRVDAADDAFTNIVVEKIMDVCRTHLCGG